MTWHLHCTMKLSLHLSEETQFTQLSLSLHPHPQQCMDPNGCCCDFRRRQQWHPWIQTKPKCYCTRVCHPDICGLFPDFETSSPFQLILMQLPSTLSFLNSKRSNYPSLLLLSSRCGSSRLILFLVDSRIGTSHTPFVLKLILFREVVE